LTHPLVINLIALRDNDEDGSLVDSAILQVYEGALLSDGSLTSPQEFVKRMTELMVQATGK